VTAWSLAVRPPARAIRRPLCGRWGAPCAPLAPLARPQARRRAMRLQVGGLGHEGLGAPRPRPPAPPSCGRTRPCRSSGSGDCGGSWGETTRRRIAPAQAAAVDEDDAAQHPPVIHARTAMALGKNGSRRAIRSPARRDRPSSPPQDREPEPHSHRTSKPGHGA
jgi:hypothetical protein